MRSSPFRANGRLNTPAARSRARKSAGRLQTASASRLTGGIPFRATAIRRTSRICRGSGMSTGHTDWQALQPTQSDWGPAAFSRPWWKGVLTSPMAPE